MSKIINITALQEGLSKAGFLFAAKPTGKWDALTAAGYAEYCRRHNLQGRLLDQPQRIEDVPQPLRDEILAADAPASDSTQTSTTKTQAPAPQAQTTKSVAAPATAPAPTPSQSAVREPVATPNPVVYHKKVGEDGAQDLTTITHGGVRGVTSAGTLPAGVKLTMTGNVIKAAGTPTTAGEGSFELHIMVGDVKLTVPVSFVIAAA